MPTARHAQDGESPDPEGDALYGIEIMVEPEHRGLKPARRLYDTRKAIGCEINLRHIILGGQVTRYGKVADQMTAAWSVEELMQRNLYDPGLTTQLANGFHLARLIPDDYPSGSDSRGYATFLVWNNIEYVEEGARRFGTSQRVRPCLVQYQMRAVASWDESAQQLRSFVDTASSYSSDFAVLPELFTTQLPAVIEARAPPEAARGRPRPPASWPRTRRRRAFRRLGGGSAASVEQPSRVAVPLDPRGRLVLQRSVAHHRWGRKSWQPRHAASLSPLTAASRSAPKRDTV